MNEPSQPNSESNPGPANDSSEAGPLPLPDPNQVTANPYGNYGAQPGTNPAPPNPYGTQPGQAPPPPPSYPPPGGYPPPHAPTANPMVESGKTAVADAASVLKRLQKDPTQGLQAALTSLGDDRALNVGLLLCSAFVLTSWWAIWRVSNAILGFLTFSFSSFGSGTDFSPGLGITDHLKIIVLSALPVVIMSGVFIAIQKIFKGQINVKQMVFVTAVSILPFTIFQLIVTLFGAGNFEFLMIILVIAFTTTVLVMNTALIDILGFTVRTAMILVPVILLVVFYIQKILLETILST
ncbi:Yip1 family protein [Acaryochloris sp. IP29b_bin.148]|uniref:Yip1 family protein n=1 Tax=Acaryochloris sp. IP29b_bin.148 TaxID=2969218 RepID=UPI00261370FA|nr:Yip1 family protein [Acaryochloris sp. IP29b_bin.148]